MQCPKCGSELDVKSVAELRDRHERALATELENAVDRLSRQVRIQGYEVAATLAQAGAILEFMEAMLGKAKQ